MDKQRYYLLQRANLLLAQTPPRKLTANDLTALAAASAPPEDGSMGDGSMGDGSMGDGSMGDGSMGDGSMMGASDLEIAVELRMRQVPTSFVHLLDPRKTPLVTFRVRNERDNAVRLRLISQVVRMSAKEVDTIEIAPGADATIDQLPVFFADRIQEVVEARIASLSVRVEELDGKLQRETSHRIVLLPRTTAYLAVHDGRGGAVDLSNYLGAWVTPNGPEVRHLLREAASHHHAEAISGYQRGGAPDLATSVRGQVKAIFAALKASGIAYVNSTVAFNLAGEAFVQRIRLPREAVRDRSANCIDGVVLMASVLEAASLDAAIALVPGHAFVGYSLAPEAGSWEFVETTMLGSGEFDDARTAAEGLAATARKIGALRVLSIPELRIRHEIFPME
jgi:hypothetical protein